MPNFVVNKRSEAVIARDDRRTCECRSELKLRNGRYVCVFPFFFFDARETDALKTRKRIFARVSQPRRLVLTQLLRQRAKRGRVSAFLFC